MNLFVLLSLLPHYFLKLLEWSLYETKTHRKSESIFVLLSLSKKGRKTKQFFELNG